MQIKGTRRRLSPWPNLHSCFQLIQTDSRRLLNLTLLCRRMVNPIFVVKQLQESSRKQLCLRSLPFSRSLGPRTKKSGNFSLNWKKGSHFEVWEASINTVLRLLISLKNRQKIGVPCRPTVHAALTCRQVYNIS